MASAALIRVLAEKLKNVQLRLAMLSLAVMIGVTVLDVILRYFFGHPIHGSYDLVESCLVVFVFNGMAACFFARRNVVIDIVDMCVGNRTLALLMRVSDAVSVVVLAVIIRAMLTPARQAFDYGDRKLELGLPLWVLWAFAIAGLAGTLFCTIGASLGVRLTRHGGEPL